ncbi:MAG: hypothetical protein HYV47_02910 [Candidatus Nealsonbacteria bacterium]|nr:hypothetical protein [Candidatus Nealsonbacteria bacterium]
MNQKAIPASKQGFIPLVIVIAVLGVAAGVGGFLAFRGEKVTAAPQFIQADFIDLAKVFAISKFRSGSGHDFSQGSGETCRSMKHYFNVLRPEGVEQLINKNKGIPPGPDGQTDIPIYSPVDGKIIGVESERMPIGEQIYIKPDFYSGFTVRLFHIYLLPDIKKGAKIKAGQKIGVIGQYQNTDIAIMQGRKFISYFEVMPDNIFAKYQALGVKNRSELIISKAERDANPLQCNGEQFAKNYDSDPNSGNFIYLKHSETPVSRSIEKPAEALHSKTSPPVIIEPKQITPPPISQTVDQSNKLPACKSNPSPSFTNHITDISKVRYIVPPPTMGAGPSLKPHSYIGTDGQNVPVYAPAAATLKSGSHSVGGPYLIEFLISCEVTVRFGHITNPVDAIKNLLPKEPQQGSQTQELEPISFSAGELIGYTTGTSQAGNWDFGVYNSTISNRYADDPNWNSSSVYTTAVCPFDYFTSSLKSAYQSKYNSYALGGNPPHGESFCQK